MNPRLKQRVVGAVVLVSLGVVVLPLLLRGPPAERPGAAAPVVLEPGAPGADDGFTSRIEPLAQPPRARAAPPAAAAGPATGWVVQLGSFSEGTNALALRDRLKALGHSAFVESASGGEGRLTRVLVGPELERDDALAELRRLRERTGLEGLVVEYPPR